MTNFRILTVCFDEGTLFVGRHLERRCERKRAVDERHVGRCCVALQVSPTHELVGGYLPSPMILIKEDRLVIEGRLTQLEGRRFVLGKRYRGSFEVARRMAHTFADEIILALSGRQGVALSQIAFYSDREGGGYFVMTALGGTPRKIAPASVAKTIGSSNPETTVSLPKMNREKRNSPSP